LKEIFPWSQKRQNDATIDPERGIKMPWRDWRTTTLVGTVGLNMARLFALVADTVTTSLL